MCMNTILFNQPWATQAGHSKHKPYDTLYTYQYMTDKQVLSPFIIFCVRGNELQDHKPVNDLHM